MPYVYRYIDLQKEEVCYVGKVTTYEDLGEAYNGLVKRHSQHKSDEWYKKIGDENLLLQYIKLESHTDADIFETWLIQYYDTGQLYMNRGGRNVNTRGTAQSRKKVSGGEHKTLANPLELSHRSRYP